MGIDDFIRWLFGVQGGNSNGVPNYMFHQLQQIIVSNEGTLYLRGKRIKELPDDIGDLENLKKLNLSYNYIEELPDNICNLKSLKKLDLCDNEIKKLPDDIGDLYNLKKLDLSENKIKKLPDSFCCLESLKKLDLSFNKIKELPDDFGDLEDLEELNLSNNRIELLPFSIGSLRKLSDLNCRSNQLKEIPASIGELKSLNSLELSNTSITKLPDTIGGLNNLKTLSLSNSLIEELPDSIGKLQNLTALYLENTKITKLPDAIGELNNLKTLSLSNSLIEELPDSIGKLQNLTELYLANTKITKLPESIGELPKLSILDLCGLSLDKIPESLSQKLPFKNSEVTSTANKGVYVQGMKLDEQLLSVFTDTPALIPTLYESINEEMTVHESKVVFLGDGKIGKSYTIKRFVNGGKKEDPANQYVTSETPGIEIVDCPVKDGEDSFKLHFWDFGGQQILHSMHRCFLTKNTCYVVMVETRSSTPTKRARFWLNNVKSFAPDSPVLLFVNCWDNDDGKRAIDESGILRDFKNIAKENIVYCSAKKAEEDEFRRFMDKLVKMASDCANRHLKVPKRWNCLYGALTEENKENKGYLTKERYYELCRLYNISDADAAKLLTIYNKLGVCFSYHEDRNTKQELSDYKLFHPVWLTNAIYAIIEEGMAGAQNGMIKTALVKQMLTNSAPEKVRSETYRRTRPDITYNEDECEYVIDVAAAYNLCYRNDDTLFFPALCTNNTPVKPLDDVADYPQHVAYRLIYTYLPDSVVHQLMIRCLKRELVLKNCWLRGMVLGGMKMHKAVISMDDDEMTLKIDIYSKAGHPAFELFKIIRDEIGAINNDLELRDIKEYIVKGEDRFEVAALLNLQDSDVEHGISGDSEKISELLGKLNSLLCSKYGTSDSEKASELLGKRTDMNITAGMLYIPIRKVEYHDCRKDDESFRQALWEVYKGKCQVCSNPIERFGLMEVDHIFPTNWDRTDESAIQCSEVLMARGVDTNKLDLVENYLPVHKDCNIRESNKVDLVTTLIRHKIALDNTQKVLTAMEKRRKALKLQQ